MEIMNFSISWAYGGNGTVIISGCRCPRGWLYWFTFYDAHLNRNRMTAISTLKSIVVYFENFNSDKATYAMEIEYQFLLKFISLLCIMMVYNFGWFVQRREFTTIFSISVLTGKAYPCIIMPASVKWFMLF